MPVTMRDRLREVTPSWLRLGVAEKLMYAIGIQFDALVDACAAAISIRFPNVHGDESLKLLGRDRKILRGDNTADVYAARLETWLDDHSTRGGPYALLDQVHGYYSSSPFVAHIVYTNGRHFEADVDGAVTMEDLDPFSSSLGWANFWLGYEWPEVVTLDETWGSGTWGDGYVWGADLSVTEVRSLRAVPESWGAAHAIGRLALLFEGGELWGLPTGTWDDPGTWGGAFVIRLH